MHSALSPCFIQIQSKFLFDSAYTERQILKDGELKWHNYARKNGWLRSNLIFYTRTHPNAIEQNGFALALTFLYHGAQLISNFMLFSLQFPFCIFWYTFSTPPPPLSLSLSRSVSLSSFMIWVRFLPIFLLVSLSLSLSLSISISLSLSLSLYHLGSCSPLSLSPFSPFSPLSPSLSPLSISLSLSLYTIKRTAKGS